MLQHGHETPSQQTAGNSGPATGSEQRIVAGRGCELPPHLLDGMFRLRHEVLHERLGWDVDSSNGRERDIYDDLDPIYLISYAEDRQRATGCCRLLPTDGRYMLPEVFPEALRGDPAPCDPSIWELSRLATDRAWSRTLTSDFGPLALGLIWEAVRWVEGNGGSTIVAVSSVALERRVNAMGVPTCRFGDGNATRLGRLRCSAYVVSTRAFIEHARRIPEHGGSTPVTFAASGDGM